MKLIANDGGLIEGKSYKEIVSRMSDEKLQEPRSLETYRKATAKRVSALCDLEIRWDTDKHFVQDMIKAGLLVPVEKAKP